MPKSSFFDGNASNTIDVFDVVVVIDDTFDWVCYYLREKQVNDLIN